MTSIGYVMYCIPYVMCVCHVSVPYIIVCIIMYVQSVYSPCYVQSVP